MRRSFAVIEKFAGPALSERQIRVRISDATPDRAGDIVEPAGCDHADYDRNPIVLADHDPTKPIGRASVEVKSDGVYALIEFAPAGASVKADEYCALAKAGILGAASIGFRDMESKPLAAGGLRFLKWELLEISLVSVPANANALIVQRAYHGESASASNVDDDHVADHDLLGWALDQLQHQAAAVAYHHEQLRKCLDFADRWNMKALARAAATGDTRLIDRLRKADYARCDAADMTDDAQEHVAALQRHVKAARGRADEIGGPVKAARGRVDEIRKREMAIAALKAKMIETDAIMDRRYPAVPKTFKVADSARQVRVILAGREHADVDLSCYRDAVLLKHEGAPIAWCFWIEHDYAGRLVASAQFPPRGVSARADKTFEDIRAGKIKAVSVGLSVIVGGRKMLKEWSFVEAGADPEARLLSIGGHPVDGARSQSEPAPMYAIDAHRQWIRRTYLPMWGLLN